MAPLDPTTRARLPDRAFAYIDSRGRRRLPIHDEAHVRNALARFNQTVFESEVARDRARTRVLRAARKLGIVPVGFMTGQLRMQERKSAAVRAVVELGDLGVTEELEERLRTALGDTTLTILHWSDSVGAYHDRSGQAVALPADGEGRAVTLLERRGRPMTALVHDPTVLRDFDFMSTVSAAVRLAVENELMQGEIEARSSDIRTFPTGLVTFLLADIEDSTGLVHRLGDRYAALLTDVRRLLRAAVRSWDGREVDARADELFAVFDRAPAALEAAVAIQRTVHAHAWPDGLEVLVRVGLHAGRPTLTENGYVGLAVNTAARVAAVAQGGQIVLSRTAREAVGGLVPAGICFTDLGQHDLRGLPGPVALFQVASTELPADLLPPATHPQPPSTDGPAAAGGVSPARAQSPLANV